MATFTADRWAEAFIHCCADGADEGFQYLKVMARSLERIGSRLSGTEDAAQVEKLVRAALAQSGSASPATEIACHTLVLLVRRGCFKSRSALFEKIEKELDRRNHVVSVILETTVPAGEDFKKSLENAVKTKTGAVQARISEKSNPSLIGGYKIHIGTKVIDASVQSLLRDLAKEIGG